MNKKGVEDNLMYKISLAVLGVAVGVILIIMINSFLKDNTYWKIYYARDIALMLDAGLSGRGDLELNYDFGEASKPLVFELREQKVLLSDYDLFKTIVGGAGSSKIKTGFRYATNNIAEIKESEIYSQSFVIKITDSFVEANETPPKKETCPEFDTKSIPEETKIYIDYRDKTTIESLIKIELQNNRFDIQSSPRSADLTIIIEDTDNSITQMFYRNSRRESEKLACLIKNSIIDKDPALEDGSVLNEEITFFSELQHLNDNSPEANTIDRSEFGLYIQNSKFNRGLAVSIVEGVLQYYGRSE